MKKCKSVDGLVKAIKKGESACLKVWDIMNNDFVEGGAYLNLGEGKYSYVGKENWNLIRNSIINEKDEYCNKLGQFRYYYK